MRACRQSGISSREAGSALLIAIFALLLISVVGIALLVSSGTDTALAGNYRTSTAAYYAAVAGLEEARGRLLTRNPDFLNKGNAYPTLFNGSGTSFGLTDVVYILNPANGETVDPTNPASPYADKEYGTEFTWQLSGANVHAPVTSVSPMAGLPGPVFKWVRINAITEKAISVDVNSDGIYDSTTPLYYTGAGLSLNSSSGPQALEVTAFAYMPDKSTKYLQYVVTQNSLQSLMGSSSLTQGFPAALILAGNGVTYTGPNSSSFYVNGTDPTFGRTCAVPPVTPVPAIGFTNQADQSNIASGTSPHQANYTGFVPPPPASATPSVEVVTLPPTFQTPSQFDALAQAITQNADDVITGPATRSNMPTTMSPTNPMMVVVNGNLDLTAWNNTGYGVLLVTGNLNYDPSASWQGVVLVIGQGTVTASTTGGSGQFEGAMIVAKTRDAAGNLLPNPNLGASSVLFNTGAGGAGIYYNSCALVQALAPFDYQVLSFREIAQ
jgi:hypothetical protein